MLLALAGWFPGSTAIELSRWRLAIQTLIWLIAVGTMLLTCLMYMKLHIVQGLTLQNLVAGEDNAASRKQAEDVAQQAWRWDLINEPLPHDPWNEGLYPLHLAARQGNYHMIKQLLMLKAAPWQETAGGRLATYYALQEGNNTQSLQLLMHACPLVDSSGRTVRDYRDELMQQPGEQVVYISAAMRQLVDKLSTGPATCKRAGLVQTAELWGGRYRKPRMNVKAATWMVLDLIWAVAPAIYVGICCSLLP